MSHKTSTPHILYTQCAMFALTKREVLTSIFKLAGDRSLLLITHRLIGLKAMDEILVLDQSRVIERGKQDVLLQAGGMYRQMWVRVEMR